MSLLPFPSDSAEYEEYCAVMDAMANEAEASTPDPEPVHSDARYTDAEVYPESQYGGDGPWNADEESDELRAREDADYYRSMYECEERYDDSVDFEDRYEVSEYGMEGCCGDF